MERDAETMQLQIINFLCAVRRQGNKDLQGMGRFLSICACASPHTNTSKQTVNSRLLIIVNSFLSSLSLSCHSCEDNPIANLLKTF
jgi:hypothetical protein